MVPSVEMCPMGMDQSAYAATSDKTNNAQTPNGILAAGAATNSTYITRGAPATGRAPQRGDLPVQLSEITQAKLLPQGRHTVGGCLYFPVSSRLYWSSPILFQDFTTVTVTHNLSIFDVFPNPRPPLRALSRSSHAPRVSH